MPIVLGIDGGGTKTVGVLARSNGDVLASGEVGATNPNSVGMKKVKQQLSALLQQLKKVDDIAYSEIKHVFAGISGAAHDKTRKELTNMMEELTNHKVPITVHHDAVTALYSGTLGEEGIVQIAGTGAITFGLTNAGEEMRVGGWGHLFSDHGSGYMIGRDALEKVFLAYDGFPIKTILTEKVLTHLQVQDVPDIVRAVFHSDGSKTLVASLSKVVMEAFREGDELAKEIIQRNARHIGASIRVLLKRLFVTEENPRNTKVVLVGGLFHELDVLQKYIYEGLAEQKENVQLKWPVTSAVGGSVVAAFKHAQIELGEHFVETFNKNII
ncbi:MAG TPA: BadF/BadG/BcrA/BcrD ATPase family protein [Bacillota bacterium]|nr:BadF/BadG/BcrA/BcrD ATPase family protein [Bacillota bacterium]